MTLYYVANSGDDSAGTGSSGSPYASPGKAASVATSIGDMIAWQYGTYTVTSSSSNVPGGRVTLASGVRMEGFQSVLGDLGAKPVLNAGSLTGITLITLAGGYGGTEDVLINVEVNGNSGASNNGVDFSNAYTHVVAACIVRNCPGTGFLGGSSSNGPAGCLADACGVGILSVAASDSAARGCTTAGFQNPGGTTPSGIAGCLAAGCAVGFNIAGYPNQLANCTAYGCTGNGFTVGYDMSVLADCIAYNNGAYGFNIAGNTATVANCAYGSNTSGNFSRTRAREIGGVSLTANPFANAAGYTSAASLADLFACFAPNNAAGGGALLRNAGYLTGADIGAVQHQDSGGVSIPPSPVSATTYFLIG